MVEATTGTKCSYCEQTRHGRCSYADCPWENDSSNEIIDRLERQIAELRASGHDSFKLACMWQDQANAAEADKARLSEALAALLKEVDREDYTYAPFVNARTALSGSGAGGWRQEQLDAMLVAIAKVEQRTGKVYVLDPNKLADFLAAAPTATGGR